MYIKNDIIKIDVTKGSGMLMDFKYLQYAIAVAEYGTITKAAQNLYIAQPNLSRALGELEEELGFSLFIRTKKGMKTTEQGRRFLTEARQLLEKFDTLAKDCREQSKQCFHFSCAPSSLLVSSILDVGGEEPAYQLIIQEPSSILCVQNIVTGASDAGLLVLATPIKDRILKYLKRQGLSWHCFAQSPLICIINKNSPLYHEEANPPYIDMEMAEVMINASYYEPIGIKLRDTPYPLPGKSIRRGASRAANMDMLDAMDELVMLSCCFHPRILEKNKLAAVPYRPEIPIYEYGYVVKQDQKMNPALSHILNQVEKRIQEIVNGQIPAGLHSMVAEPCESAPHG